MVLVPIWAVAVALIVGGVLGALTTRLLWRSSGPPAAPLAGTTANGSPSLTTEPERAPQPEPEAAAEPLRIDMEDVVSELERRYQGRKEAEKAQRRSRRKG